MSERGTWEDAFGHVLGEHAAWIGKEIDDQKEQHRYDNEDKGGFAFPCTNPDYWCNGMTMLDWFAGKIARSAYQMQQDHGLSPREVAEGCYRMAEAMVAEKRRREK